MALSNFVRFRRIDKSKQTLAFVKSYCIMFINKTMLEKYLKDHCSKEELSILIKARNSNPAIKELDICYYYSNYFKDVFKYFDIEYMHAYISFFRFMINYIMGEEMGEEIDE